MAKMGLVEKFYSVQGEGANAGRAALFIRFAGCNLDCVFADGSICDTPWHKAQEKLTLDELLVWVDEMCRPFQVKKPDDEPFALPRFGVAPMVILTGGEPTMAPVFDELVEDLKARGLYVAVETNGTRWRDGLNIVDWIVVSPKTNVRHQAPLDTPTPDPRVMRACNELRIVISGPDSLLPGAWMAEYMCVSPALKSDGTGKEWEEGVPDFAPGAVEKCMEIVQRNPRWRLSLQTHKWIRQR